MKTINELSYPIHIEDSKLNNLPKLLKKYTYKNRVYVVSDLNVWNIHSKNLLDSLRNFDVVVTLIEAGEKSKGLDGFNELTKSLIEKGILREDLLVAFGGGVVGDLVGFVASTLYRGIKFVNIPTTVLSQVDSSIGSKVGINFHEGKNILGSFKDPKFVYVFLPYLETLSKREFNNGMAEVIKIGLISDKTLLEDILLELDTKVFVEKAIKNKIKFILEDKFENNKRKLLNFGHTLGHAIESMNKYENIKHGEAISHGIIYAIKLGIKEKISDVKMLDYVYDILNRFELLNIKIGEYKEYFKYFKRDKKQIKEGIQFIFLKSIENPKVKVMRGKDLNVD